MATIERLEGDFAGVGKWEIERVGQEPAWEGDMIRVRAVIKLPLKPNHIELVESIQFSQRLALMDETLEGDWGYLEKEYRWKDRMFFSSSWADAFAQAKAYLEEEEQKLLSMIRAREQALVDAESPER